MGLCIFFENINFKTPWGSPDCQLVPLHRDFSEVGDPVGSVAWLAPSYGDVCGPIDIVNPTQWIWSTFEDFKRTLPRAGVCTMKDFRAVGSPFQRSRFEAADAQTRTSHLRFLITASHTIQISESDDDYSMPTLRFSLVFGPASSLHNSWAFWQRRLAQSISWRKTTKNFTINNSVISQKVCN